MFSGQSERVLPNGERCGCINSDNGARRTTGRAWPHAPHPDPHGCQPAAPVQLGRHRCMSMQAISAESGFVAKTYLLVTLAALLRQLVDLVGAIGDDPKVTNFLAAASFRPSQPKSSPCAHAAHENAVVRRARSPCLRLGVGPSGAILDRSLPRAGHPPTQRANIGHG